MKVHLLYVGTRKDYTLEPKLYAIYATREMAECVGKLLMEYDKNTTITIHSVEVIENN